MDQPVEKIRPIIEKTCTPVVMQYVLFVEHLFPIIKFLIQQAFKNDDKAIMNNPIELLDKVQGQGKKCLLILEIIRQFKKKNNNDLVNRYKKYFLTQIDSVSNEFEKKEVLVNYIDLIR